MKSRLTWLLSLLIAVCILLPQISICVSVSASEQTETMQEAIVRQYDAFAASLNRADIDKDAIRQMLNHAITGRGKHLTLDENAALTGCIMNSNTYKAFMHEALVASIEYMQEARETKLLMGGGVGWHDFACTYSASHYAYNDTKDISDDERIATFVKSTQYTGSVNGNDKALMLVVGHSRNRIRITQTKLAVDTISYHIQIYAEDEFDFNSDYSSADDKGYDTSLCKLINKVGKLLDYGLLDTYSWEISADFDIVVQNKCPHEGGNYRWEFNGTDLVTVTEGGFTQNVLTRIQTQKSDGTWKKPYYQTEKTVYLWHDMPWVVEFRMKGSKAFTLAPAKSWNTEMPFLVKTSAHCMGGTYFKYQEINSETGEEVTKGGRDQYGIEFKKFGYKHNKMLTYRLENRIEPDGSNMVYLLIDGEELGPMTTHYINKGGTNYDQEEQGNWFCGTDFLVNYIFNASCGFDTALEIEYIQIWERGESATNWSYFEGVATEPTCTAQGYTTYTCKLCGAAYDADATAALGHHYASTVTEPTCTQQGYTSYACTRCGDSYVGDYQNAKGHSLIQHEGKPATCTEGGWKDYETCANCNYTTFAETGPMGHQYTPVTVAPTCLLDGKTTYTCHCGDTYEERIPATGHSYEKVVTLPTCLQGGYTTYTCHCGDHYEDEYTQAFGHTEVTDAAVAATCTQNGLTEGKHCSTCGTVLIAQEEIPALEHDYVSTTIEPTCTENGSTTYTCHCGDTYAEQIPATGHVSTHREGASEATCGVSGYTGDQVCDICGATVEMGTEIPATGVHAYGEWVTVIEPAIGHEGLQERTCSCCGHIEQETLEALPVLMGDVNGDGRINARDARTLLCYVAGLISEDEMNLVAADYNGDGLINARDARSLLIHIANLQ